MDGARYKVKYDSIKQGDYIEVIEWLIKDVDSFKGFTDSYLVNGVNPFDGKTRDEYIEMGYSVLTTDEVSELEKRFKKSLIGHWTETTKDQYFYALDVLPPLKWRNGGFFVSEADYSTLYPFYQEWLGKYYYSLQDITSKRDEIIDSLKEYLK